MADDREHIDERTEHIPLAVSCESMGYCCLTSLLRRGREERTIHQGETFVSPPPRNIFLSPWLVCVLYLCIASPIAWSDSDKTIVDLERGRPEAASRYHRPHAEHLYQYDKTQVDLAVPLPQPPAEEQRASQRPATPTPPAPAPANPPQQAPLPGGDR